MAKTVKRFLFCYFELDSINLNYQITKIIMIKKISVEFELVMLDWLHVISVNASNSKNPRQNRKKHDYFQYKWDVRLTSILALSELTLCLPFGNSTRFYKLHFSNKIVFDMQGDNELDSFWRESVVYWL